ncbi:MAG: diguanylate cyclase, partial [Candidatus Omnitrophica bacterium]|nr:diguanylate cyclase [Candidatus Omnitrophota bacterium]
MDTLSAWFQGNLDVIFFIYGLAFFVMATAIFSQDVRGSRFKLAGVLRLLGWFGLTHGVNEWLDGWTLIKGRHVSFDIARFFMLALSFFFLFEFGRRLFRLQRENYPPFLKNIAGQLTPWISPLIVIVIYLLSAPSHDFWESGAILVRYYLGFTGGMLSGIGFLLYYNYEKGAEVAKTKKYFVSSSVFFLLYGLLGGLVVHKGHYFPSVLLNDETFLDIFHIPVQVFRAICAMMAGWATIGILKIFNLEAIKKLEEEVDRRQVSEAERESLTKQLLETNENLKKLALRDSHTGLYNHAYLIHSIETELSRCKRYGRDLSVIFMDIDYFKSINDVYGHQFGDLVLKQLAGNLKKIARASDIVARYGGEEFVVLSPEIDLQSAVVFAQRIIAAINSYEFGNGVYTVKIKISAAVSSYPADYVHRGIDLIEIADHILMKAKEHGGNRVYSSENLRAEKESAAEAMPEAGDVRTLKDKLQKLTKRANQSVIEATAAFAKTIELKDHDTGGHAEKTVFYAAEIAKALGLSKECVENVRQASMLHDLGKV